MDEHRVRCSTQLRRAALGAAVAAMLFMVGCVSVPPGTGLRSGTLAAVRAERTAWLRAISITDPELEHRDSTEESLSLETARFIREAGYLSQLNLMPGNVGPDDCVLRFEIDRYRMERSVHPAYFPGALLTLTIYIWAGGPIVRDRIDLSGTLTVEDSAGRQLARVSESLHDSRNVSIWSNEYALPSGIEGRTTFMRSLVERAVAELQRVSHSQMQGR